MSGDRRAATNGKPAQVLRAARDIQARFTDRTPTLGVLSSFTAEFLGPYIVVESDAIRWPVRPWFGPFGQFEQMTEEGSPLLRERPDAVWIALRLEDLEPSLADRFDRIGLDEAASRVGAVAKRAISIASTLRSRTSATLLVSNFLVPDLLRVRPFDAGDPRGLSHLVAATNHDLAKGLAAVRDTHVFDWSSVAAERGHAGWSDPKYWYMARAGVAPENLGYLATWLVRYLAAVSRPGAKCVVVDLDNTLWGGVLGDDGLAGIQIGGTYPGNVFRDFQAALLGLTGRGILLAIASKNDESTVLEALSSHPEMLLHPSDFACIRAGWERKSESLAVIARTLNIGLESLVFLDDNPVERAEVREALPAVMVPDLPASPLGYLAALRAVTSLDRPAVLAEDARRTALYREQVERQELERQLSGSEFLVELRMEARVGTAGPGTLERIHQLIQKTNQFNLTTRRHKLDEIGAMAESPAASVAWLRLSDRFGDMGLVCVGIVTISELSVAEVETLLMSCRVMGRGVEAAFLSFLAERAALLGARQLRGHYIPTARNGIVRDFYRNMGFHPDPSAGEGEGWFKAVEPGAFPWPAFVRRVDEEEAG